MKTFLLVSTSCNFPRNSVHFMYPLNFQSRFFLSYTIESLDRINFRLFKKPEPSTKKNFKGTAKKEKGSKSETLKVLSMERSRQVGIRASSFRLAIEEMHDVILGMDDQRMDLDT